MKLKILITILFLLSLFGCSATNISLDTTNEGPINYLPYDETEITSLGPVVGYGNGALLVVDGRTQNFYKLEEVTSETIIFSAHRQGKSSVTYAPQKGVYIRDAQSKNYTIFFKNPDGTLVDLGKANFSDQVSAEEYFKLKRDVTGYWYAELEKNNSVIKWLNHRKEDGTYKILFKEYVGQELRDQQIERGTWSFSDGFYSTKAQSITTDQGTQQIDSLDEYFRESFWVKYLTDNEMEYVHIKTGAEFKAIRVDSDFDF